MSFYDGWYFGLGFGIALVTIRLIPALIVTILERSLAKLREEQVINYARLAELKRRIAFIDRALGRDPDAK